MFKVGGGCCKNDASVVDFQKAMRVEGAFLEGSHTHAHTYQCGECRGVLKNWRRRGEEGIRKHKT